MDTFKGLITFLEQFVTVNETGLIHYDALSYSTDKEIQDKSQQERLW